MKKKPSANRIVWYEIAAFGVIVAISWANELGGLARRLFGGTYAPNWQDAATETGIALGVAIPTVLLTWRLSQRLHHLEGFLRVCSWCHKVGRGDDWISFEKFLAQELKTQTTHGICPACSRKLEEERPQE
jgi:hypothetical protein